MKNKLFVLFAGIKLLTLGLFVLSSCSQGITPGDHAEKFLTAMSTGDLETAKLMVDNDSESVIISVDQAGVKVNGKKANIIIVDETTKGEQSIVKFKYGEDGKVNTLRLKSGEEDWEIRIDGDSEDIVIGEESLKEVLAGVDLTVEEALEMSSDAVKAGLKVAGKALEGLGKILQGVSEDINLENIDLDNINLENLNLKDLDANLEKLGKDLEDLEINFEGSEEDMEKAKAELTKALEKMKEAFEEKK